MKEFSITEVRDQLSWFVRRVERNGPIQITRRGKPVAVLISLDAFERLQARQRGFYDAYESFRASVNPKELGLTGEEFSGLRVPSRGRES